MSNMTLEDAEDFGEEPEQEVIAYRTIRALHPNKEAYDKLIQAVHPFYHNYYTRGTAEKILKACYDNILDALDREE